MNIENLKEFLDEKVEIYNRPDFIESDPIQVAKRFSDKEDHYYPTNQKIGKF